MNEYPTVTPYLMVKGAQQLITFLEEVFDAHTRDIEQNDDGTIRNAEIEMGDSLVMAADARGEWVPTPGSIYLMVDDVDKRYNQALGLGATSVMEPANQAYGHRSSGVKDMTGCIWWISGPIK